MINGCKLELPYMIIKVGVTIYPHQYLDNVDEITVEMWEQIIVIYITMWTYIFIALYGDLKKAHWKKHIGKKRTGKKRTRINPH